MSSLFIHRLVILVSIVIALSPQIGSAGDVGWGKVSPAEWSLGAPADFPEANAVVLHDVCTLTVRLGGIEVTRWKRMKLLSKAGAEEIGDVGFPYFESDRIKDLRAQTITPDGKGIKLSSKDYFTKTIEGVKYRTFAFPGLDSGCIVEFQYRNLNVRFANLDPWFFQSEIYTYKSSFTLVIGPGFTYGSSWSNLPMSKRNSRDGQMPNMDDPRQPLKTFTWEIDNLEPITDEPYMSSRSDYLKAVYFQLVGYQDSYQTINFINSWQDLGKEFQDYIDGYAHGGGLDELAAQLISGITDTVEKAKAIYRYVTKEIVLKPGGEPYFVQNEDIGGLRKTGTGNGAENNILLNELLKKAGLKAWPVLICTREQRRFNPEIYQLQQFDYLISFLQIDSSVIYLDAAGKYCPFGMLPPDCLVDAGFLVDGKESQLVRVIREEPRTYRLDMTAMRIDSAGSVSCSTSSSLTGYFVPEYGPAAEESAANDFVKKYYLDRLGVPFTLDTAEVSVDTAGKCLISIKYSLPEYTRLLDSVLTIRPVSYRYRTTPFTKPKRSIPVDFNYPFTYHNIVTIASDRPISSAMLPPDTSFQIDGATYRRTSQFADGQVTIDSRLIITVPTFSPLVYPGLRRLFEFIAQSQSESAALVRQ